MERFKTVCHYLVSWVLIPMQRKAQAMSAERIPRLFVPVVVDSFRTVRETDQPQLPKSIAVRAAPHTRENAKVHRQRSVRQALSEVVLWFGLLFSAVLIGTFIVLGLAMCYALLMSLTGN